MSGPTPGQPFIASPGPRVSVGDPDATPGSDAYSGVVIIEAGAPSANIVEATDPFDLKVYFKTALAWVPLSLPPATFDVRFHIHDLSGTAVMGSPFVGGPLVTPDPPAGAAAAVAPDEVTWSSSTVTIPPNTLALNTTYRITTFGHDTVGTIMAFHDGTIIHTQD